MRLYILLKINKVEKITKTYLEGIKVLIEEEEEKKKKKPGQIWRGQGKFAEIQENGVCLCICPDDISLCIVGKGGGMCFIFVRLLIYF